MSNELISDELKGKSGIYKIINLVNGKLYIGSAVDLKRRKREHWKEFRGKRHWNIYLQRSWNKYKEENFKFEVVEYVEDKNKLIEREQYWIDIYFDNKKKCYNISPTANSCQGIIRSDETKLKISIAKGSKPFYVFKDKQFVGEWISQSDCGNKLNIKSSEISGCLRRKSNYTHEYIFIYKDEYSEEKFNEIYGRLESRPFFVFNKYTKEFLGEYMSQVQCANNFNIRKGDISSCLSQHIKLKSIENYIFIYKDEYTSGKLEKMCELYDKSFYIYTKNDCEFIGEFNSLKKCSDYLGLDSRRISDCLKNNLKYASNYIFIYIKNYSKEKLNELYKIANLKNVFKVYKKHTNEFIGEYDSQIECAEILNINYKGISDCLNNRQKSAYGYTFEKVS